MKMFFFFTGFKYKNFFHVLMKSCVVSLQVTYKILH